MAYITVEEVAAIRKALKERFPNCRFSVRRRDRQALSVSVMKSPYDFSNVLNDNGYARINPYLIPSLIAQISEESVAFLILVRETILNVGNHWDESDIQSDYFNCAFYYDISVGQWDKGHVQIDAPLDLANAYRINELHIAC